MWELFQPGQARKACCEASSTTETGRDISEKGTIGE